MQDDTTTTLSEVIGRLEASAMNGPAELELRRSLQEEYTAGCREYRSQGVLRIDTSEVFHRVAGHIPGTGTLDVGRRARLLQVSSRAFRSALVDCASRYLDEVASRPRESRDRLGTSPGQEGTVIFDVDRAHRMLALDAALGTIEEENAVQARIVECEFFGRMNPGETAAALGVDRTTLRRERLAAWVRLRELMHTKGGSGGRHVPG